MQNWPFFCYRKKGYVRHILGGASKTFVDKFLYFLTTYLSTPTLTKINIFELNPPIFVNVICERPLMTFLKSEGRIADGSQYL